MGLFLYNHGHFRLFKQLPKATLTKFIQLNLSFFAFIPLFHKKNIYAYAYKRYAMSNYHLYLSPNEEFLLRACWVRRQLAEYLRIPLFQAFLGKRRN